MFHDANESPHFYKIYEQKLKTWKGNCHPLEPIYSIYSIQHFGQTIIIRFQEHSMNDTALKVRVLVD